MSHKYYFNALITRDGDSHLVEFFSDDMVEIATLHQKYMMLQQPEFYGLEPPSTFEVSNVSRIVSVRNCK